MRRTSDSLSRRPPAEMNSPTDGRGRARNAGFGAGAACLGAAALATGLAAGLALAAGAGFLPLTSFMAFAASFLNVPAFLAAGFLLLFLRLVIGIRDSEQRGPRCVSGLRFEAGRYSIGGGERQRNCRAPGRFRGE